MARTHRRHGAQATRGDGIQAQEGLYKSSPGKLVRFFAQSRTQWKAKCRAAKTTIKVLKKRIRFLEESKANWKNRAKALKREVARLATSPKGPRAERNKL